MEELGIPKSRRRALRHQAKHFLLPYYSETKHLRFVEALEPLVFVLSKMTSRLSLEHPMRIVDTMRLP